MNRGIRQTVTFVFILILALLINLTWIQGFQQDRYAQNPLNSRQFLEEKSTPRGQITAGGEILASSEKNEDGYYDRVYGPNAQAWAPITGYLSDVYGSAGLEQSRNSILNGSDPSLFTSRAIDLITGKESAGANIELSVIPEAQMTAYDELANNGYTGSVVALRPSTGEVLAMASNPTYDPAAIAAGDEEAWAQYISDPDLPLTNRGAQHPLPPGSTFKVLTTIAALENGATPDTQVTGAPNITLPGTNTTLENYGGNACGGGGTVPLSEAFARSCNTAFVELAIDTGAEPLREVAERFRVGETFDGLGVPQDQSTIGDIPDDAALGQTAIGQRDVSFTTMQNALIAAAIANGGVMMEPHLVKNVQGQDLSTLQQVKPNALGEAIHPDTAEIMTDLMRRSQAQSGGDSNWIASKTGTAEHGEVRGEYAPHVWWIGFAPDSDIAVAVVVENGGNMGGGATGATVARPVGEAVIRAIEQAER